MQEPSSHLHDLADRLDRDLAESDALVRARYPGDDGRRQPVHTVYVPADRYDAGLPQHWGAQALAVLDDHLPDPQALARVVGVDEAVAEQVLPLVRAKLRAEPIEDLRIDFEDGFGDRGDDVEDAAVRGAARELRAAFTAGTATPYSGIRFKSLEPSTRRRGLRTLDHMVGLLAEQGRLPTGFVLTLPKVTAVEQVGAMVAACAVIERAHGLAPASLRFEIQVETPQSVVTPYGASAVPLMLAAADGRCTGLHYGTYDYSASLGISASQQSMEHPVADHAKAVVQVAAAGTGVRLSDGSTNVLPVGEPEAVVAALGLHARLVRRSLDRGFYQGWDLHPAQLPTRYAATFSFYREGLPSALARLQAYLGSRDSGFLDEPATARAMAWFVARALDCGAATTEEVEEGSSAGVPAVRELAHPRR